MAEGRETVGKRRTRNKRDHNEIDSPRKKYFAFFQLHEAAKLICKLVFKIYISVISFFFHWKADTEWSTSKMNVLGSYWGRYTDYSRHFHSTGPSFSSQIQSWMLVFSSVPKLLYTKQLRQLLAFNCLIILDYFCSKGTSFKEDRPPLEQYYLCNNKCSHTCALHVPPDFLRVTTQLAKNGSCGRGLIFFLYILKDLFHW